jgi:hypothetical protein
MRESIIQVRSLLDAFVCHTRLTVLRASYWLPRTTNASFVYGDASTVAQRRMYVSALGSRRGRALQVGQRDRINHIIISCCMDINGSCSSIRELGQEEEEEEEGG